MITDDSFSLDHTILDLELLVEKTEPNEIPGLIMLINRAKVISFPQTCVESAERLYKAGLALVDGLPLTTAVREAYAMCLHQDYRFFIDK